MDKQPKQNWEKIQEALNAGLQEHIQRIETEINQLDDIDWDMPGELKKKETQAVVSKVNTQFKRCFEIFPNTALSRNQESGKLSHNEC